MPIICCPHCGAKRTIPQESLPRKKTQARCPECRAHFNFEPPCLEATTGVSKKNQHSSGLISIGNLLTRSWELFCHRSWGLLAIYLLGLLLIFAPLVVAIGTFSPRIENVRHLPWAFLFPWIVYVLFGITWMSSAMLQNLVDPQTGIRTAMSRGLRNIGNVFELMLLLGFVVAGGSLLLLIPGLIFSIWFSFSQFILTEEKIAALAALDKSRKLVAGYSWQIFHRLTLLLLLSLGAHSLAKNIPVIGDTVYLLFALLAVPFFLIFSHLIYQDLKRCQQSSPSKGGPDHRWQYLSVALIGWLLIPYLFIVDPLQVLITLKSSHRPTAKILNQQTGKAATLVELIEDQTPKINFPAPEKLTAEDYDRLLLEKSLPTDPLGVALGPAVLSAQRFWVDDQNPHLWLKVRLADLPNLALSARRSTRILIEKVLDSDQQDQYDRHHSYESSPFQWIDIRPSETELNYSGIRNVYLKEGARPEKISNIVGRLELTLPLGIESYQFSRQDIGKTFSVAGKTLKLETLANDRLSLSFQGELAQILSVRAFDQLAEPLREEGETWQSDGHQLSLQQMFNGQIDAVTVLVATGSLTRSYPFEITH